MIPYLKNNLITSIQSYIQTEKFFASYLPIRYVKNTNTGDKRNKTG